MSFFENLTVKEGGAVGEVQATPTPNTILGRLAKLLFDPIVGRLEIIDHLHAEIHAGGMWYADYLYQTGLANVTQNFLFVGSATAETHVSFGYECDSKVWLQINKVTGATAGTDLTSASVHNAKHSITGSPGSKMYEAASAGTSGMLMHWSYLDKEERDHKKEHILAPGEQVLIQVTPDKDNINVRLTASFYEE